MVLQKLLELATRFVFCASFMYFQYFVPVCVGEARAENE